jgi:hypothetical protein
MATGPTFEPADGENPDAVPTREDDMLDVVAGLDREINRLAAAKALALDLAHRAQLETVNRGFDSRVLAERSFRAEVAALLAISERAAENLIGVSGALVTTLPGTLKSLGEGDISWRHATIMVDETAGLPGGDQLRLEQLVLSRPDRLTPPKFARILRKAREELNPETIAERHGAACETRGLSVDDGRDGMSDLILHLDSTHAHAIFNKATTGAHAMNDPLDDRTLDQRRADILTHVLLATVDGEAFGVVPDEWDDTNFVHWYRGIAAEVAVTVPVLALLGESETPATLEGWVPIDPITARIIASGSKSFIRLLTHPRRAPYCRSDENATKYPKTSGDTYRSEISPADSPAAG